ncbi:hypothetical protein [Sphingomonas sp. ERG5]|uniref:hypothetical protein n=1 Tax=Sphingomonas sp. ERG5 TaxID=1381597 RepID=UPI00054B03D0|nr:hypothetical protein [Sphingomonas sp. ERG5]
MSKMRLILAAALALTATPCFADKPASTPALPAALPALGADWMPDPDPSDAVTHPGLWPRGNATAAGLDDMIHDERLSAHLSSNGRSASGRILRSVSGGYLVVPLLKLHFPHRR